MRLHWKRLLSIKTILLLFGVLFFVGIISRLGDDNDATFGIQGRQASIYSPLRRISFSLELGKWFSLLFQAKNAYYEHGKSWAKYPLEERCRYYFEETFNINPGWTNDHVKEFHNNENLDNLLGELMVERIRMFDSCFISGGLPISDVFKSSSFDAKDVEIRIFPFLRKYSNLKELWPDIIHANHWTQIPMFNNPVLEGRDIWKLDDHYSFWYNWVNMASGKGIVLSLSPRHADQFKKLLLTLEEIGNSLPIQIIHNGMELSEGFMLDIKAFIELRGLSQQVYFVNISPLIDPQYSDKYISFFINKWMALLFNTFSEVILLDADVVSFVPIDSYFNLPEYKETGILLYKDRDMPVENTFDYCIEAFKKLFPSGEELHFMGHKPIFSDASLEGGPDPTEASTESRIFYNFFQKKHLHHVDSGLVVIDRRKKIGSITLSTMLHINGKIQRCVYGDKELFWLGQLFSGENYRVDSNNAAIVGRLQELEDGTSEVCATQLAHVTSGGELIWLNGGLQGCKVEDSAKMDFDHDAEYFTKKYGNPAALQGLYDLPLSIEAYVIPEIELHPWTKALECKQYTYCARARNGEGLADKFTNEQSKMYHKISEKWNEDVKL